MEISSEILEMLYEGKTVAEILKSEPAQKIRYTELLMAGVPMRYLHTARFDEVKIYGGEKHKGIINALKKQAIQGFLPEEGKIIGLIGINGTGKTMVSIAMLRILVNRSIIGLHRFYHRYQRYQGDYFAPEIGYSTINDLYRRYTAVEPHEQEKTFKDITRKDVWVIDELQDFPQSEAAIRFLVDFWKKAYEEKKSWVFCTNLGIGKNPSDIKENQLWRFVGNAIYDRWRETMELYGFNWISYRKLLLQQRSKNHEQ